MPRRVLRSWWLLLSVVLGVASPLAAVAEEPLTLPIDDFSGLNAFTKDQVLNPYHEQAGDPLWCRPGPCPTQLGDVAFHTNALGYYTSGYNDALQVSNFVVVTDREGHLQLTWEDRPYDVYWYSALSLPGESFDLSAYRYLAFRVKGQVGGEDFGVRIDNGAVQSTPVRVSAYAQIPAPTDRPSDWQTCVIPLSAFGLDTSKPVPATVVTFVFDDPRSGHATETVFVDDLQFEFDPTYRPAPSTFVKPISQGPVRIKNGALFVDGKRYLIKGVGYAPTPIGQTPDAGFGDYEPYTQPIVQRDFPLLAQMSVNTVRVWGRFDLARREWVEGETYRIERTYDNTALLDDGAEPFGMKVCAGFWIPYQIAFSNTWATERLTEEFRGYVTRYRFEPALLMWVIGNENNFVNGYDWRWYQFANALAKVAYEAEGNTYHPVAIVEADLETIGTPDLASDDAHLSYVDLIGINAYRGKSWAPFFSSYTAKTKKPLWISEYGIDAWDTTRDQEDQAAQVDYDVKGWLEIFRARARCVGATVMAYSDEWWKDKGFPPEALAAHLSLHDDGGFNLSALPDGFANEEWWGLVSVERQEGQVDRVTPRTALTALYSPTIGGKVKAADGQDLAEATVTLVPGQLPPRSTTTDADGLYAFTGLSPGTYVVVATTSGYSSGRRRVSVTAQRDTALADFVLRKRTMGSSP
ncbi:MAG: carboxypeptidase regulatory-like domain-containing protein [Candidatus Omnitrophota bacterium]|nr:carboxypeptidase regulatory-like domain-containing protein [Candidatus Omnitrophota bacterium]